MLMHALITLLVFFIIVRPLRINLILDVRYLIICKNPEP